MSAPRMTAERKEEIKNRTFGMENGITYVYSEWRDELFAELQAVEQERDRIKQDMHLAVSNAGKDLLAERDLLRRRVEGLRKELIPALEYLDSWEPEMDEPEFQMRESFRRALLADDALAGSK